MQAEDPHSGRLTLLRLFLKFLRFGALAFGGPIAQIAMIRQALVEEERWIEPARFNRLLAVMQALPGPEAHELCVHMGMIARGRLGGLLAGLGFMLPGLVLMLLCGWAYVTFISGQTGLSGVLLGVQVAVLAVIGRAVQRIGQHILIDLTLAGIAVVGALAVLAGVPFWVLLIAGGIAYAPAWPRLSALALLLAMAVAGWMAFGPEIMSGPATLGQPVATHASLAALFVAGLKGGLLTFGGAYTAIPYVRADTVGRGWLGDGTFLDGVAVANLLPAPLVIFATFAGYVAGGFWGALAITAGMFLPAFAFSMVFFERLEQIVEHQRLHRALDGIAAAAVGIIAATLVQLALAAGDRVTNMPLALAIFAAALLAAWRFRGGWVAPLIVAGGALAGWLAPL